MHPVKIVYWQDEGKWLGYLLDYPDYWTQAETLEELKINLNDLFCDITKLHLS
ncbi:hypothetical protein LLG95_06805 [bacterium]|nr:hypothetical protein [bacterium]